MGRRTIRWVPLGVGHAGCWKDRVAGPLECDHMKGGSCRKPLRTKGRSKPGCREQMMKRWTGLAERPLECDQTEQLAKRLKDLLEGPLECEQTEGVPRQKQRRRLSPARS